VNVHKTFVTYSQGAEQNGSFSGDLNENASSRRIFLLFSYYFYSNLIEAMPKEKARQEGALWVASAVEAAGARASSLAGL
jgi:hypothetical protein